MSDESQPSRAEIFNRNEFAGYLNRYGLTGSAVEVGCHRGDFCVPFRQVWEGGTLHCVDSYMTQDGRKHWEDFGMLADRMDKVCAGTRNKKWWFHGMSSVTAAEYFTSESLDFVYLDASHNYDNVANDLRAWYPKLKSGGLLAGHDFINGDWKNIIDNPTKDEVRQMIYGVKFAVEEFTKERDYTFNLTREGIKSWYFHKR
jgi:hypothetical protein